MNHPQHPSSLPPALYTQFCIGVERGDEPLVRSLMSRGADPTVSYAVDGVVTTPVRSSLMRGDAAMMLVLLNNRSTRVHLRDLDAAPLMNRDLMTPILVRRLGTALNDDDREELIRRSSAPTKRRGVKTSLAQQVKEYVSTNNLSSSSEDMSTGSLPQASPQDKPRCPPPEMTTQSASSSDEEDEEDEDQDSSDDESGDDDISSLASSAGDDDE